MTRLLAALLFATASLHATPVASDAARMEGTVFVDRNGNGRQDQDEPGLKGVGMSNGRDIVRTDSRGRYAIAVRAGEIVFAIKPAGFAVGRRADGLPAAWQAWPATRFDVPLHREPRRDTGLDMLVFGDPQPQTQVDVGYYRRDIVEPLVGHARAVLGLSLGDITSDNPSLYSDINRATMLLGLPWLHVAGNHDVDAKAMDDTHALETFRKVYGPDTFAWEEPEATVVGLDDVISSPGSKPAYIGGIREDQFAFLQAYLATAPRGRLLVLAMHIPLFEPPGKDTFRDADRARLFAMLRPFPHVLVLSAHMHTQQHVFHDARDGWNGAQPLHEYNVGAACGAYWSGVKDAEGIPAATMPDGTPNGYATLHVVAGGAYALAWHPARDPADTQVALHAPKVLRQGAYPAWGLYANVYMGAEDTPVSFRVDGGDWKPMAKVTQPDPDLLAENARDDAAPALRGYDRSPEATPSPHLWRAALPTSLAVGTHTVEVRVIDRWRGEQHAHTSYRLEDASP